MLELNKLYNMDCMEGMKEFPDKKYFDELTRISKNEIIWGWNYYTDILGKSESLIFWDKGIGCGYSRGEIAITSFNHKIKLVKISRNSERTKFPAIHPCQKPIALYRWLLQNYAKPGDKIIDTHAGSASSVIACLEEGFEYCAFELDVDYFTAATKRIEDWKEQGRLFNVR